MSLEPESTADRPKQRAGSSQPELPYLFCAFQAGDEGSFIPSRHVLFEIGEVTIGRGTEPSVTRQSAVRGASPTPATLALRFADAWMSANHATLDQQGDTYVLRDRGSRNGSFVNGTRVDEKALEDGDVLELGNLFFVFRKKVRGSPTDRADTRLTDLAETTLLRTISPDLGRVFARTLAAAPSELTICLGGETGTGKEVVARAVHERSLRRGAFVAVNCSAIAPSLVESELFGYRKGAFSGATEHREGLVKSADGGTLFLDEIGDMPLPAQAALLRVLQEREVLPVGGTRTIPVDIRVIVATHKDLDELVAQGLFRADLKARLLGLSTHLPPLRERKEDLGVLGHALLRRHFRDEVPALSLAAARALFAHDWPFNVRELDRRIAGAAVLREGSALEPDHLLFEDETSRPSRPPTGVSMSPVGASMAPGRADTPLGPEDEVRKAEVLAALEAHDWNITAAAKAMGKARSQMQRWMIRFQLRR
ncbi:MAG: sigma 54-interacting transcriptional regulator [Polyangiaceae bacterium]